MCHGKNTNRQEGCTRSLFSQATDEKHYLIVDIPVWICDTWDVYGVYNDNRLFPKARYQ